jgi:hypothetical protein
LFSLILGLAFLELSADAEEKIGPARPAADQARRPPAPVLLSVDVVPDAPAAARAADGAVTVRVVPDAPAALRPQVQAHQASTDAAVPVSIAR